MNEQCRDSPRRLLRPARSMALLDHKNDDPGLIAPESDNIAHPLLTTSSYAP